MNKKIPLISAYAIFTVAIALITASGCDSRAEQAAAYNDEIIRRQAKIVQAINGLDSSLNNIEFESMGQRKNELVTAIDEGLVELNQLGPFNEDSTFLAATKGLFQAYHDLVESDYSRLIELISLPDTAFTSEVQEEAFAVERRVVERIRTLHAGFEQAQTQFGNTYRLEFPQD
jgi:hypothetical protein